MDDEPLIFFHFHHLKRRRTWLFETDFAPHGARLNRILKEDVFTPYCRLLDASGRRGRARARRARGRRAAFHDARRPPLARCGRRCPTSPTAIFWCMSADGCSNRMDSLPCTLVVTEAPFGLNNGFGVTLNTFFSGWDAERLFVLLHARGDGRLA